MNLEEIMHIFADPTQTFTLSAMDKLVASLVVTLLGMGITYIVLILLQYACQLLSVSIKRMEDRAAVTEVEANIKANRAAASSSAGESHEASGNDEVENDEDEQELIAVLTAAVAAAMGSSVSSVKIRNVKRIKDHSDQWAHLGRLEHMASRQ